MWRHRRRKKIGKSSPLSLTITRFFLFHLNLTVIRRYRFGWQCGRHRHNDRTIGSRKTGIAEASIHICANLQKTWAFRRHRWWMGRQFNLRLDRNIRYCSDWLDIWFDRCKGKGWRTFDLHTPNSRRRAFHYGPNHSQCIHSMVLYHSSFWVNWQRREIMEYSAFEWFDPHNYLLAFVFDTFDWYDRAWIQLIHTFGCWLTITIFALQRTAFHIPANQ